MRRRDEVRYVPRHARRRRILGPKATGVVTAAVLAAGAGPAGAASASSRVSTPSEPRHLPAGIEPYAPYQPQEICYPDPQPGVLAFSSLVLRTYRGTSSGGIVRACDIGAQSEHKDGRAWDWMVNSQDKHQHAEATALLRWLTATDARGYRAANARRLGIMYIVWDRHIWKSYRSSLGWQPYSGPDSHSGHVHFSFGWAGALGQTSFFTKRVAPPVLPPLLPLLRPGSTGPDVRDLQHMLGVKKANGYYGKQTREAVSRFQRAHHLAGRGRLTRATWAALLPPATPVPSPVPVSPLGGSTRVLRPGASGAEVRDLQRLVAVHVDGGFGPATESAVRAFQKRHHLVADGVVGTQTWHQLRKSYAAAHRPKPHKPPKSIPVLREGATGAAVRDLQKRLHLQADGTFGPATDHAVRSYQRKHHIDADGVVGAQTWRAIRS